MKKTGKKLISVLTALLLVAALAGCTTAPAVDAGEKDRLPRVGIVQLAEHAALDSACEGFIAALAENGFVDGETVEIDLQNAQGDQSNLSTIGERFLGEKVDLILAIATPAAQAMAGKTTEIPILATAVTDYESAKLVNSNAAPGGNVSGTTDRVDRAACTRYQDHRLHLQWRRGQFGAAGRYRKGGDRSVGTWL